MLTISVDRKKISNNITATVSVFSDYMFDAVEVRATKAGEPYMRGLGYALLADEKIYGYSPADGTVYFDSPVSYFNFSVSAPELGTDGKYRISVYVRDTLGVWNDVCPVYTSEMQQLTDVNGAHIFVCRDGTGTDEQYKSACKGVHIDNFIHEVLFNA